jgi:SAM-dependent methyltransferase
MNVATRVAIQAAESVGLSPRRIWHRIRRGRDVFLDVLHNAVNRDESALPPPSMRTVGGGDFHLVGTLNVRNIKQFTSLEGKRILEVGCGCGRNALALSTYDVAYEGLDIFSPFIAWCQRHISRLHPNFLFHHVDVYNGAYNPRGTIRPEAFAFPFGDKSFDLVILTSVFTHMLEPEVRRYLDEIARVLKPGGDVYVTYFLLNKEANRLLTEGRGTQAMKPIDGERVKVIDYSMPEAAVGLDETMIVAAMESKGLLVRELRYGSWCGRSSFFDYQDVIFATRHDSG